MELFLSKIHSVQHILFSLKLNYKPLANEFLHFQANMTCQNQNVLGRFSLTMPGTFLQMNYFAPWFKLYDINGP